MSKLQDKPPVCQNYEEVWNGGSLTEAVKYYFANGIRIAKRTSALANAMRYTHSDHLGSASVMTDASGNVIKKMGHIPYGSLAYSVDGAESVVDPSTTGITNYTFTGQESDWDTGLLYYNARYYDAELGRFITGDPSKVIIGLNPDLSIPERLNQYMYCLNNPVMYTDPTGLVTYVIISAFPGGGVQNVGTTFFDAANTRAREIKKSENFNPDEDSIIVYNIDSKKELEEIFEAGDIDNLEMFGHGGSDFFVVGSGDGPGEREILFNEDIEQLNPDAINEDGEIVLHHCFGASEKKEGYDDKLPEKNMAETMKDHFDVKVTGNKGGGIAVPSPDAEIDPNFVHKSGDDVWYKSWGGTRAYVPQRPKYDGNGNIIGF